MCLGQLFCAKEQSECRAVTQVCGRQYLSQARLLALLIISGVTLTASAFIIKALQFFVKLIWMISIVQRSAFSNIWSLFLSSLSPVCRATSNNKVKDMVLLELSYVNSNLQLLMGQLEGLNSSVDVYQNTQWVHMLPLLLFSQLIVLLPHSSSNMVSAYMCQACPWLVFISLSTRRPRLSEWDRGTFPLE